MADKKITALTALTAAGKVAANDLLHIIDYSASPVNKKISVAHLFDQANCAITSYGAFTHDFGPTNAISGLSVVVPNATPAASAETEVVVNDDGNAFVDFRVQTSLNDTAFHIDSSLDSGAGNCNTITINGGAIAGTKKVDFKVNSSTGILVHCDSTDHAVGIGTAAPDTAYLLDVAAVGGKSIKTAGGIDVTGVSTITGNTTITGTASITSDTTIGGELIKLTTTRIGTSGAATTAIAGGANGSEVVVPIDSLITHLNPADTTNAYYSLAAGAQGQLKFIMNITAHDLHIESATIGGASGTEIQLTANECCMLLYSGGSGGSAGWWNIGGGTAVA